jgi:hypothetical protein
MSLTWIETTPPAFGVIALANPSAKTTYRVQQQTDTTYLTACLVLIGNGPGTTNYNVAQDCPNIDAAKTAAQSDWDSGIRP